MMTYGLNMILRSQPEEITRKEFHFYFLFKQQILHKLGLKKLEFYSLSSVEELVLIMLSNPKETLSCPVKMGNFYQNFLNCILTTFGMKFPAYADTIKYIEDKINTCHFDLLTNLDIENYGDSVLDQYAIILLSELEYLNRLSDEKRIQICNSIFAGIDAKLAKLVDLKNSITERLVGIAPQPSVNEGFLHEDDGTNTSSEDELDDDPVEETVSFPLQHTYCPLLLIEAENMKNIFNDTTLRRLFELSREDYQSFQKAPSLVTERNGSGFHPVFAAAEEMEIAEEAEFQSDYDIIFEELHSRVSCLKILNNLCLIGCIDGVLRLGSLESMTIIDSFQAHNLTITSITTWKQRIFTTSFDKSIRCFNLETQSIKKLGLLESLTCADHDGDGILYTGTSQGNIYQLNMLALTIISQFVQVGSEPIDNIIILRADHPVIRKMLICTDNAVTLRDCSSGELLLTLRFENVVLCAYSPLTDKIFAASTDCIYQANALENDSRVIQMLPFSAGGTSLLHYHGMLLVSDNEGNTRIFDENLNVLGFMKGAHNDVITCMAPWKNYVISYFSESGSIGKALLRRE